MRAVAVSGVVLKILGHLCQAVQVEAIEVGVDHGASRAVSDDLQMLHTLITLPSQLYAGYTVVLMIAYLNSFLPKVHSRTITALGLIAVVITMT